MLLENARTGGLDRRGLGNEALAAENPGLVYCSVSGYGRSGALADRPGYDPVAQGESGLMSLTGEPDGPPMRTGVSLVDIMAGMYAAQAVLAALVARGRTGRGQRIDVPLFDTAVSSRKQKKFGDRGMDDAERRKSCQYKTLQVALAAATPRAAPVPPAAESTNPNTTAPATPPRPGRAGRAASTTGRFSTFSRPWESRSASA